MNTLQILYRYCIRPWRVKDLLYQTQKLEKDNQRLSSMIDTWQRKSCHADPNSPIQVCRNWIAKFRTSHAQLVGDNTIMTAGKLSAQLGKYPIDTPVVLISGPESAVYHKYFTVNSFGEKSGDAIVVKRLTEDFVRTDSPSSENVIVLWPLK